MHWTWRDTERQCALSIQLVLLACYVPVSAVAIVMGPKQANLSNLVVALGIANTLVYLNSTLNPFLYCWKISEVRQVVKLRIRQALCCPWTWIPLVWQSWYNFQNWPTKSRLLLENQLSHCWSCCWYFLLLSWKKVNRNSVTTLCIGTYHYTFTTTHNRNNLIFLSCLS